MGTLQVGQKATLNDKCFDDYTSLRKHSIVFHAEFGEIVNVSEDPENRFPTWYMIQFRKGKKVFTVDLPEEYFEVYEDNVKKFWDNIADDMEEDLKEAEDIEKEDTKTDESDNETKEIKFV